MERIELEGMKFYAFHGHYPVEKEVGNEFLVNLKIKLFETKAIITDNLSDALNYQEVYNMVKNEMEIKSNLLEHLAQRILDRIFECYEEIIEAEIKISKLNPPMGGEIQQVSVILTQKNNKTNREFNI